MIQTSVSGIKSLFSPTSPSISQYKLESCIEEAHTYGLLFPEAARHFDPSQIATAASSADDRGGLDISPRDVRIVVAQDGPAHSPHKKNVLYDSHPPRTPDSQSWTSFYTEEVSRRQRAGSLAGSHGGLTGGTLKSTNTQKPRTAPHSRQSSFSQTAQSALTSPISPLSAVNEIGGLYKRFEGQTPSGRPGTRDGETDTLLNCMFGNDSGLASTSGTKLHVRPPKSSPTIQEHRPGSAARDSANTASFPKRRTPLTRSTTASEFQSEPNDGARQAPRHSGCAIWITRLFCVDLEDSHDRYDAEPGSALGTFSRKEKADRVKAPRIAIAIVLQMPSHRQRLPTPAPNRSPGNVASSPPSLPFEWTQNLNIPGLDPNGDIDNVTAHWDVIDRALTELGVIARCKIASYRRSRPLSQWTLQLPAGALQELPYFRDETARIRKRIALAFRIRKVATGQNRWDSWRAEARFIQKWGNSRDQNFFFFNLLTNFLALHTEWLESLAPIHYRRQHERRSKKTQDPSDQLQHRTIIVSKDKMAARRMIFLLSAFLPGRRFNSASDERIDSNWTKNAYSASPPSSRNSRQQSLRKTINRRAKDIPTKEYNNVSELSISLAGSSMKPIQGNVTDCQNTPQSSRRASDAKPVALLITSDGSVTRKSSSTITTTIKPEPAGPVTYFANPSTISAMESAEGQRPSSSESLAAPLALQRTLSRSDSNEHSTVSNDSRPGSIWGSLGKFWIGRRGSSTEASEPLGSSEEGLGISGVAQDVGRPPTLSRMVAELETAKVDRSRHFNDMNGIGRQGTAEQSPIPSLRGLNTSLVDISPLKQNMQTEPFPLKLSVDEDDGIVDVDLPQAGSFPSSFGSTASSLAIMNTAASSFNDRSSLHHGTPNLTRLHSGPDSNVAGWLRDWHQGFTLQAVRPRKDLMSDIKSSMRRTSATVLSTSDEEDGVNEWNDISTTLVADAESFTVTRLCLRRKDTTSHQRSATSLQCPNRDVSHEEQIVEESLMDMDPTLIDAVEKIISHSGESSRVASRTTSRTPSPSRRRPREGNPGLEIPYSECRQTVLGALEQVAKSVSAEMAAHDHGGKGVDKQGKEKVPLAEENTLREGVRKWFQDVDRHSV